jgi:TolA-binding protein
MRWILAAVGAYLCLHAGAAASAESDPLPVPQGGAREQAVVAYNDGVKLMLEKRYAAAQSKFEEAVAHFEGSRRSAQQPRLQPAHAGAQQLTGP